MGMRPLPPPIAPAVTVLGRAIEPTSRRTVAERHISVLRVGKRAIAAFFADDMPTYAAALAYRVLFSIFPFLIFLTTLLGFLGIPELFEWMRGQAAYVLPEQAMKLVNTVLGELQEQQRGLMSVAIALAVWSASAAVLGAINALNVAYKVTERRPTWKRMLVSIVYTLALALMLIIAAGMMLTGPTLLTWLAGYARLDSVFITVWTWARWPITAFILLCAVAIVYWAAPNVKQPFRLITPGALIAVAAWIGASVAFGYYVQNFSSYNATYGSMGAVIVLLMFFFLSAAVVLFGAEVNATLSRERGEHVEEGAAP